MSNLLLFFSFLILSTLNTTLQLKLLNLWSTKTRESTQKLKNAQSFQPYSKPYIAVMIVPTGIGASIGGYAGDALPSAKLLSTATDLLITHPNVMNGAMLYWLQDNILYVEGSSLDAFAANKLLLEPFIGARNQKIGLLLDCGMEKALLLRHIQVAESMKATLGIDIAHIVLTSQPAQVTTKVSEYSGASWGSVENIESLIEGAEKLKELGCTAIAVVARFPEDDEPKEQQREKANHQGNENKEADSLRNEIKTTAEFFQDYRKGEGVDAIAGVEAIISRIISQRVGLPCAHAPAFLPMDADEEVSPKAAAEEIGYTFLPCVLAYLHRAPNIIPADPLGQDTQWKKNLIHGSDVDAVIVPHNALGGPAVLSFLSQGKLVIAVLENHTTMAITKEALLSSLTKDNLFDRKKLSSQIILVHSYAEAAGYLLAHKHGIQFESITSKVSKIPILQL